MILIALLELTHIQVSVNQQAVDGFEIELHFAFCFQFQDKQVGGAFQGFLVTEVYESRIEGFLAAGVQTVVSQVLHGFQVQRLYADEFVILLVVRQGKAQCVDGFEVCAFYLDFNDFIFVVVIFGKRTVACRIDLVNTQVLVDLRYIIIRIGHRDNRAALHEYQKFPQRSREVIDHAIAGILFAGEVIHPSTYAVPFIH